METEAILHEFNSLVERYAKHRNYIAKAKEKAHKFSSDVVEKVILDHEIKSSEVADGILPLVPDLEGNVASLESERDKIGEQKIVADRSMEELQLRLEIEELSLEDFESNSAELKAELDKAATQLESLQLEIETIMEALDLWTELAVAADQETGRAGSAEPEPVVDEVFDPIVEDEPIIASEVVVEEGDGSHVSRGRMVEDVSAIFGKQEEAVADDSTGGEPMMAIEADEGDLAAMEHSEEIDFGLAAESADLGGVEVELNLEETGGEVMGDEIDISVAVGGADDQIPDTRRALLLYQEGTAEEQIYPFTGDILTVGRGRDNDIQIKNDSKVSRYHCKVYRRGANFYIEDNKSSNGTLVNGELITERRLFGGEEIIIGETFFRFRIME